MANQITTPIICWLKIWDQISASAMNINILWLPLRRPLEPLVLHPPHADQDIFAELRLSSWLKIHISFSSIIYYMYHYTVNIDHSSLVYLTYYLRPKVVIPNVIFKLFKIHLVNLGINSKLFNLSKLFFLIRG